MQKMLSKTPPFKSKLMIDTVANASETYNEVFMVCLKTSSKRRAAIWGQRFGTCGDSSQRVTRPHLVPLRPLDSSNVDVVMEHIEKVLNSLQELSVNDSSGQ